MALVGRLLGYAHQRNSPSFAQPRVTVQVTLQIGRRHRKAHVCLNISRHAAHVILAACNTAPFGLPPSEEMKHPDSLAVFIQTPSRWSLSLKPEIWSYQHHPIFWMLPSHGSHPAQGIPIFTLCPFFHSAYVLPFRQYNCNMVSYL